MKAIICVLATLITSTALAYKDGTYTCKIGDTGFERVIQIETITMGNGTTKVPHVNVKRSYKQGDKVYTTEAQGFATIHKTNDREALMLAQLRFDFINDQLQNCVTE